MHRRQHATVGREHELGLARAFVDEHSGPGALVLCGPAGIGKSAIWATTLGDAEIRGRTVQTCRCSEADSGWAFTGLGDLLDGLDETLLMGLPPVQQHALSAALLLSGPVDSAPGSRVLGAAVLGVLRILAGRGPVVLGVDDVQWLDPSSRQVLSFAFRRLVDEPVRLVATVRTESELTTPIAPGLGLDAVLVAVGPVSVGVLQQILKTQLGAHLSRPVLTRLHHATGGNPMLALEMARSLQRNDRELTADEPLSVPADFTMLVGQRLAGLSGPTRALLLMSAALAHPTLALLGTAMGDAATAARCVAEAVAADVLERHEDRIRFTHPLLASVPYAELTPDERRSLHSVLAAAVTEAEEHARHAALASSARSAVVASALDDAVVQARGRGSIDAAAELAELAVTRTPMHDVDGHLRRGVSAAEHLFRLGDPVRARALLTVALERAAPGPHRVPGLLLAATIASWESGDATVAAWCDQALAEAGPDRLLAARAHATFAETCPSGAEVDLGHARRAVTLLDALDAPPADLLAAALTNLAVHACRVGQGLAVDVLERAVELEARGPAVPITDRAALALGMYLKVIDRFDESRRWLTTVRTWCLDEGDEMALPITVGHLATLACWAGDFEVALQHGAAGREHAERMDVRAPMPTSAHVLALAHLGRIDEARRLADGDLAADDALGYASAVALHLRSRGVTELFAGDAEAAADCLLRARAISSDEVGIGEPAILRLHGDAVEALVTLGRIDEARELTDQLDASTGSNHHHWSTAVAGRCHGLLEAAGGDLSASLESLHRALVDHRLVPMPFEAARTQWLLGRVLRRRGHVTDARREMDAARSVFAGLGAQRHETLVRADLARLGGRRRQAEITAVEQRICDLVVLGHTNREVAAALFLSVRTVDSHLGRIYRKLGVRSRTELARHRNTQPPPAT